MAFLGIEGATQGFDESGVNSYWNSLKTEMIDKAEQQLANLTNINSTVNSVWRGTSAETYKENFAHDVNIIIKAIEEAKVALEGAIRNTESNMSHLDETLVTKRSGESGGGAR